MDEQDLSKLLIRTFSGCDGFDVDGVQKLATELASASGAVARVAGAKPAASAPDEKQKACYARQQHDRKEHDANCQRADQRRRRNLMSALQDRGYDWLSRTVIAMDILDLDGGVINQHTDRQR